MLLFLIVLLAGLIICLAGVYFRRLTSALLGFFSGLLAAIVIIVTVFHGSNFGNTAIVLFAVIGLADALLSARYYKGMTAINNGLAVFSSVFTYGLLDNAINSSSIIIPTLIAISGAVLAAILTLRFFDISYISFSALIGAVISSAGWIGLMQIQDLEDILLDVILSGGKSLIPALVGTLLLTILGIFSQFLQLKVHKQNSGTMQPVPGNLLFLLYNAIKDEDYGAIISEFVHEAVLFIIPIFGLYGFSVLIYYTGNLFQGTWQYTIYQLSENIVASITLGTFVYFAAKKKAGFVIAVSVLFSILYLLPRLSGIQYYGLWMIVCMIIHYPIFFISLICIVRLIHQKDFQIISLSVFAVLFDRILFDDLMYLRLVKGVSIYVFFDAAITMGTAYFLCSIHDNSKHRALQKTGLPAKTLSPTSSNSQRRNYPPASTHTAATPIERRTSPTKQPMTSRCKYCGTPITEGKTICRRCYTERTAKRNDQITATHTKQNSDHQFNQFTKHTTSSKILYCPECFTVAENGTVKCPHCGSTLQEI